jgi:hypothetical protein
VTLALGVAVAALLVALAALGYAVAVGRQGGATASTLARHRHGHTQRDGLADPGAARSARAGGRPAEPTYGPATTELSAINDPGARTAERPAPRLPRPGQIGRDGR